MEDASARLVAHALAVEWRALPRATQLRTLEFLGDSLAVGVAGRNAAFADAVLGSATLWAGGSQPGGSFVLGAPGIRLAAPYAAYVNAYQIHAQEYDCVHEPAVAHPMATVLAAIMAQAARSDDCHGADFLSALVAGVDVVATLGMAVKGPLTFFRPATAGIFGCVAALARLRRLDPATARNAFGYALAYASGTMQAHAEGKPTLALQVAGAARSAVEAVDLAVAGLPGPQGSIDGPFGYLALFENDTDIAPELARLGQGWRIDELSWKPFPTGRAAHGAIVALRSLVEEHGVSIDSLERFEYHAPPLISRLVGRPARPDMSVAYARLCFPWLGALLLRDGTITLDAFSSQNIGDPQLLDLARRIEVQVNDNSDQAAFAPATGLAILRDGRAIRVHVESQYGSPQWPLDEAAQLAKWRACLAFGGLAGREEALRSLVAGLDTLCDVAGGLAGIVAS